MELKPPKFYGKVLNCLKLWTVESCLDWVAMTRSYDVPVAPDSSFSAESSSSPSAHTNCPLPELLLANDIHTQFTKWIMENILFVYMDAKEITYSSKQVSIEEGEAKARDLNVMLIETSAKAGFNIKALFRKIAAALPGMERLSSTKQEDMADVNIKSSNAAATQSQPQSGGCAC